MKQQMTLRSLLVIPSLLLGLSLHAMALTVHVETPGSLSSYIASNEKDQITSLTLTGDLNGTDIRFIREMAGWNLDGYATSGKLSALDISGANIVAGGGTYYYAYSYSSDNTIGNYMFLNCSRLTSVTIPNSVTSIGDCAFQNCSGLTSISIPNSVTSIGDNAFYKCIGLTSVTIGNSVTSIGDRAFQYCSGLTSFTIPNSVTSIGDCAFQYCSGLKDIISQGRNSAQLGSSCFDGVNRTTCILWVPESATEGYSSAQGWNDFNNIIEEGTVIEYDVTLLGAGQLLNTLGANNLKHVTKLTISGQINGTDILLIRSKLPFLRILNMENAIIVSGGVAYYEGITTTDNQIGNYAFGGCSGLTSATIPNSVTSIGDFAFQGCSGLTSFTIPNGVTSIGNYAFGGCSGLKEIHSRSTIPPIAESNSFDEINKITCKLYIPKGSYTNYWLAAGWGDFWGDFTNIVEGYTITATSSPADKGSVTGGGTFDYNSDVTLTATAATGYDFVNWTVNAAEVSNVNPFVFKAIGALDLVANFKIQSYAIDATAGTGGSLTGAATYEYGKPVSLVATATTGYDFVNWTEGGTEVSKDLMLSFTAEAARTLIANFKIQSYDVAVEIISEGFGTVTGAGTYEYGSTATLVATPAEGYVFDKWIVNSTESTDPTLEFTVTGAVSVQAQFSLYNGMEGTEESTIAVFPTLVKDEFTIAHAEAFKMNVYDNNGRLILSKIVTDAAYVISASDWTSGIYHILLTNGKIVVKERIVKE